MLGSVPKGVIIFSLKAKTAKKGTLHEVKDYF